MLQTSQADVQSLSNPAVDDTTSLADTQRSTGVLDPSLNPPLIAQLPPMIYISIY